MDKNLGFIIPHIVNILVIIFLLVMGFYSYSKHYFAYGLLTTLGGMTLSMIGLSYILNPTGE